MKDKFTGRSGRILWGSKYRSRFARIVFITCLCLISIASAAQREYFVFIQEPTGRPFYVRLEEHSFSSSAGGHIILPSMKDSLYNMYVGFPGGQFREHLFNVKVENSDIGFELKFIDGAWQLLNLKTMQLMRAAKQQQLHQDEIKREDAYSRLMAGVVNDSAVLYSRVEVEDSVQVVDSANVEAQVAKAEARERDTSALRVEGNGTERIPDGAGTVDNKRKNQGNKQDAKKNKGDTANVAVKDSAKHVVNQNNDLVETDRSQPNEKSQVINNKIQVGGRDPRDIIRYRTENIVEGKLMIYIDRTAEVADTIRIIVPRL